MQTRSLLTLTVLAVLLLAPLAAAADSHQEQPKPVTWISYVMSQTGKANALSQHIAKGGAKIYDGLMADGHVLAWGVALPVNHRAGDDWNVMEWVTFRDWAALDTFMQGFMAMQMAKSPEEMKAEQEEWYSLIEPGSHYDEMYRHQVFEPGQGQPPAYFNLAYHTAVPGQGQSLVKQFKEWAKPVMAKLVEAGTVGSFGLATAEVHGGTGGSHVFWYSMPNLAARDAVGAAFDAAAKERGEEAQKQLMEKFAAAVDPSAHHDRILLVTHRGGGGGGDDG